jgi:archaellum component FlaF (FlaF/FlaG flagellin family)
MKNFMVERDQEDPMKLTQVAPVLGSMLLLTACDKGGSNFSITSSSAQYEQASTYVPRKLDVLFVVDNSGSMSSSQASLAQNFPSFINFFKAKGYDFKIAVTTTDAYYGDQFVNQSCSLCNQEQTRFRSGTNPKIYEIDKDTPNLESVFASNVNVGTAGSGDERAFSSFKAALNSSLNAGFHRSDAYLSIVLVSDEEDFSHDDINLNESYTQPTLHTVASYKTYLETFTAGVAGTDFSVSTISVLDTACKNTLGSGRKIATRYMELADATSGTKNSLCSNFDQVLNNISTTIASQIVATFHLSRTPVVSSIRVLIDGVLIAQDSAEGWSYDSATNSVSVHGSATPKSGAVVTINFDPASVN